MLGVCGTFAIYAQCSLAAFAVPGVLLARLMGLDGRIAVTVACIANAIIGGLLGVGVSRWKVPMGIPVNVCRNCGYDLRGNTSGVCPECGKPRIGGNQ